jgi:hypothetical protein
VFVGMGDTLRSVKDKDISKFELRDIIDAIVHEIAHLERSQQELAFALQENPSDEVFIAAYRENVGVLERKQQTTKELKQYLKEIDMAYYKQHYTEPPTTTRTIVEDVANAADGSGGVYL